MTQTTTLGPYLRGELIARGEYSTVYRVTDPTDGRDLTAKLYRPTGAPEAGELAGWHEEFRDEIRRLRRHGRDLIRIEHEGRSGDLAWVVTESPQGDFLEDLLADEPLPWSLALHLVGEIGSALDRMHNESLVHRSLKPSNIVVDNEGGVRFLDAALLGRFSEAVLAGSLPLERVRCVAPEVVLGYRQRASANRYALGVIAYRALTARWPFEADTAVDYAYATVYSRPAAASETGAGLPASVDPVFEKALSSDPEHRHATCALFVEELRAVLTAASVPDRREDAHDPAVAVTPVAPLPIMPAPEPEAGDGLRDYPPLEWFRPASRIYEIEAEPWPDAPATLPPVEPDGDAEAAPTQQESGAPTMGELLQMPLPDVAPEIVITRPLPEAEPAPEPEPEPELEMATETEPESAPEPELEPQFERQFEPEPERNVESSAAEALRPVTPPPPSPPRARPKVSPAVMTPEPSAAMSWQPPARPPLLTRIAERVTAAWHLGTGAILRFVPGSAASGDQPLREVYLADWREAGEPASRTEDWTASMVPTWQFEVRPQDEPGWLRIDGRYSGPAPAEIEIKGRAGDLVRIEFMRDGRAVDEFDLKLHPLMDAIWEPRG